MPTCMWASTQPGNAKEFLASNTSLASAAWMSGARRAIRPSAIAMSRQSTDVLLGRTTRAFLITRSKDWSMVSPTNARPVVGRLHRGVVSWAERRQFFRADQGVIAAGRHDDCISAQARTQVLRISHGHIPR